MASRTPIESKALGELGLYDACTPIPIAIPVSPVDQQPETKKWLEERKRSHQ